MKPALTLALTLAFAPAPAGAQQQVPGGTVREGTLSFDARATAGDFSGSTTTVRGEMTGSELTAVRGFVEAPASSLVTGNRKRDKDLNKSLETDKYPTIRFDLEGVTPGAPRGDTLDVTLKGRFTIIEGNVIVELKYTRVAERTQFRIGEAATHGHFHFGVMLFDPLAAAQGGIQVAGKRNGNGHQFGL